MSLPQAFILPCGRTVSTKAYVTAWKRLKALPPGTLVDGWEWYQVTAGKILKDISAGVLDRINRRAGIVIPSDLPKHAKDTMWEVRCASMRAKGCRVCGSVIPSHIKVNPNNSMGYICPDCQKSRCQ